MADYYRRLSQPARFATPAKKAMRVEATASPAEDVASSRSSRRRQPARPDVKKEESSQDEEGENNKSKQEATTYVDFLCFFLCLAGLGRVMLT